MPAKRIRCVCGTIYDPSQRQECPSCGEPYQASAPTPPPTVDFEEPLAEPVPPPRKRERAVPSGPSAFEQWMRLARERWQSWPPPVRKKVALGGAGFLLLLLVIALLPSGPAEAPTPARHADADAPAPAPAAVPAPKPADNHRDAPPVATPSGKRQWIVDAHNSPGSDGGDLPAIVAKAAPGDTITLRAGVYSGGFALDRPLTISGDPAAPNQAVIQSGNQPAIEVRAQGVTLQHLLFVSGGQNAAVVLSPGAAVEFTGCQITGVGPLGLLVNRNAKIKATKCTLSAEHGAALRLEPQVQAQLEACSFTGGQEGISMGEGAQADVTGCTFEGLAMRGMKASIITLAGKGARLGVVNSVFQANAGGVNVLDGASLTVTDSTFRENGAFGASGEAGGILFVRAAKAVVTGSTFEENQYGLAAANGGSLEIERCMIAGCGSPAQQPYATMLSAVPVSGVGTGTLVAIRQTGIVQSPSTAMIIVRGATLTLEDSEISDSPSALIAGDRGGPPAQAQIKRSFFMRNGFALSARSAATVTVEEGDYRDNGTAILGTDAGTRVTLRKLAITTSRDYGIHAHTGSEITAEDCTIEDNARGAQSGLQNKSSGRATLTLTRCGINNSRVYALGACAQSLLTANECTFEDNPNLLYRERSAVVKGVPESEPGSEETAPSTSPARRSAERSERSVERRPSTPRRSYTPRERSSGRDYERARDAAESIRRNVRRFFP